MISKCWQSLMNIAWGSLQPGILGWLGWEVEDDGHGEFPIDVAIKTWRFLFATFGRVHMMPLSSKIRSNCVLTMWTILASFLITPKKILTATEKKIMRHVLLKTWLCPRRCLDSRRGNRIPPRSRNCVVIWGSIWIIHNHQKVLPQSEA